MGKTWCEVVLSINEVNYIEERVPHFYELPKMKEELHDTVKSINNVLSITKGNGEPSLSNLSPALRNFNEERE